MSGIKDVAKRAGVSISTVSNVLNKSKYVSPELVRRVELAVEELSYEANPIARSMKNNKTGTIGVITEDICGVFYPYVVKGINSVADEKGYQIMICDAQGTYGDNQAIKREKELFRRMIASRVDGIIFVSSVSTENREKYFSQIKKQANKYKNIPLVSIERDLTSVGIDSVYFDGYANARMATQHLIECGCKKIGHITGPTHMEIVKERVKGYKDCLKENNLYLGEEMIANGDYSHLSGYVAVKQLMEQVPDMDGLFCGNDQMAIGVMKYLNEHGKRIPEDIKLMGYDDVFLASVVEPSLSTIHVRKRHAGIEAVKMLFKRIENPNENFGQPVGIKMDARLVVRQSTVKTVSGDWDLVDW